MSDNGSSGTRSEAGSLAHPNAAAARPVAAPAGTQFEDAPSDNDAPPHPPHFLSPPRPRHPPADADDGFDEEEGGIQAMRGEPKLVEDGDDAPPPHPTQLGTAAGEEIPGPAPAAKAAVKSPELMEDDGAPVPAGHDFDEEKGGIEAAIGKIKLAEDDNGDAPPPHPAQLGSATGECGPAAKVAAASPGLVEDDDASAPEGPTIVAPADEPQERTALPPSSRPAPPSRTIEPPAAAVPMIFRPPPRSMLPPPNDEPQENDEPPSHQPRAPSIPQLEARLVESDEEATVYSAVQMTPLTPTRWEQHKRCIIAVFAIFFAVVVMLTVSLAIQGGSGDVQADPSPLFGDCSDRVKERRTDCSGGSSNAECKQFLSGGCGPQEREESPLVEQEWDCRSSGAMTVCTLDVVCCRSTFPPVVAPTTPPTGFETTSRPVAAPPIAPIMEETSRPTGAPFAAPATTPPTSPPAGSETTSRPTEPSPATPVTTPPANPPAGQPRPSLRPTKAPSTNTTTPWGAPIAKWVRRGEDLDGEMAFDLSGGSVALSSDGTVLAVGASLNDGAGHDAGHVRVHEWDAPAAKWVRRGEDLDGDATGDYSGHSVALSSDGTVLAIGAKGNDGASNNAGHVRVYAWDAPAAKWVRRGEDLDGEGAGDTSGRSVALSGAGTVLAVGATGNDGAGMNAGHVRVYAWDAPAAEWVQRGEDFDGEGNCDNSGWSVALSSDGTVLAVGAKKNNGDGKGNWAGHVRVHVWDALAAKWVQRGDDLNGEAAGDQSGYSVALSSDGTVLAVGATENDGAGNNAGHVRVYAWEAPAAEWVQRGGDIDGEASGDNSGWSVALSSDGTVLAVGATENDGADNRAGHVRVYAWDAPAAKWVRCGEDLDGEAAGDNSGWSVALSSDGTVLAVGATERHGSGNNPGHVSVHSWHAANKA